jgi:hypothetical protein
MAKRKIIDEAKLQSLLNEGLPLWAVQKKMEVSRTVISKAMKRLNLKSKYVQHISDERKKRLSEIRKAFWRNNPDRHPWRKSDKFFSVPCQKAKDYLKAKHIPYVEEFIPDLIEQRSYSIDIAFPDKMIAVEINGNQHYNRDGSLKPYYKERHDIIENNGWKVYEIHYSMCFNEKVLDSLFEKILNDTVKAPFDYEHCAIQKQERCVGKPRFKKPAVKVSDIDPNWRHRPQPHNRKVVRPSKEELEQLIQNNSFLALSRKFGVSDNAIRKWCKLYGIDWKLKKSLTLSN